MISKSGQTLPHKITRKVTIPRVPDKILIDCLVDRGGLPERIARDWMKSPQMIFSAQNFWLDVGDADKGNKDAKERVDYCRERWEWLKDAEKALGNDPERKVTPFKLPSGQELLVEGDTVRTVPAKIKPLI